MMMKVMRVRVNDSRGFWVLGWLEIFAFGSIHQDSPFTREMRGPESERESESASEIARVRRLLTA